MSDSPHPALRFVAPLRDLAEGRTDPSVWLAWWVAHSAEVEAACPRGWFLKLKPKQAEQSADGAAHASQQGAYEVLSNLNIDFTRSDRYLKAWQEHLQKFIAAAKAEQKARRETFEPMLAALARVFPKFARFLGKRAEDVDRLEGPANEEDLAAAEQALGSPLPRTLRDFLLCTRGLSLDGLSLGLEEVCRHPAVVGEPAAETICLGEYWLESDGDQVLVAYSTTPVPDPPVYYYAHAAGTNTARRLAPSFSTWVESLPRSPLFRE